MKIYNTSFSHTAVNFKCPAQTTKLSVWNYEKQWTQLFTCGVPQWKLSSKFSKKTKKKTFSDNCYYQKRYFYRKPLNQWLKLGLQVPKNPRHCKRHNWGPAQFKPLPQYSHNSAPFDDQSLKFNSSVRFVKNVYVSTMRENGLNALLLHFIHKGIALDCNAIIDDFAKRNQKRMSFISDSSMPRSDWFSVIFGGCNNMNKGNDAVDSCLSLLLRFPFGNRLWDEKKKKKKSLDCYSKALPEY